MVQGPGAFGVGGTGSQDGEAEEEGCGVSPYVNATYAWRFQSSSSNKVYETLRWSDNSLSCDCPGWTRRVAKDGSRSCKHVRSVLLKSASYDALSEGPVKMNEHIKPDLITIPKIA